MRKFLITVTTFILATTLILSGCSCTKKSPLSFTNYFSGGGAATDVDIGYKEVLEYDVSYVDKYQENGASIVKDSLIDNAFSFEYTDGKYKSELTVEAFYPENLPKSNILKANGGTYDKNLYHLTTELSIKVTYTPKNGGESKTCEDSVKSEVYFTDYGFSYAPIYSKTEAKYSIVYFDGTKVAVDEVSYNYKTTYNTEIYTIEKFAYNENGEQVENEKKEYEYTFKTVVDNTQLLFLARNVDVAKDAQFSMPTVTPQYGDAMTLALKNFDEITTKVNFNYDGDEIKEEDMSVKCLSFAIDSQKNSGTPQYLKIQKAKSNKVSYNALLIEYAEPLVTYGSSSCMGALKYTLKSVSISK